MKKLNCLSLAMILIAACAWQNAEGSEPAAQASSQNTASLSQDQQKSAAIKVEPPAPARITPKIKGYGRVVDPAALAGMIGDVTTAQAARDASQAELKRLKTLAAQNNASEKALQDSEAAAARDQAQLEAARLKLLGNWGEAIANRDDLAAFVQSLGNLQSALVRVDLPAGEILKWTPKSARLMTLSGERIDASYLGTAPSVDPQTQSEGFLFLVQPNSMKLAPGAAVVGHLETPGEPQAGYEIPGSAILRYEGATWIYVQEGSTNFVRHTISLEEPLDNGWFASSGVSTNDKIVVTGAQTILSQELNGSGIASGGD